MTWHFLAIQSGLGEALAGQPLLALALLFGAGVLTSLTPCIYPMIPITVGVITRERGASSPAVPVITPTVMGIIG